MKYKIKVSSIWEPGQRKDLQGKPHQEDSMFPQHGQATGDDSLFILCDGMGGHDAGEVASATVCEAMRQSINSIYPDEGLPFGDSLVVRVVEDAFNALDKKATELGKDPKAKKQMGTTMTFLKLHRDGATVAHIGDSRVYHIRGGSSVEETKVLWRTEDHSLVSDLIRIGEMTEEEAKTSGQKNVITRALQPFADRRPKADIHTITDLRPGDFFYMCTDGMLENMEDRQLCFFFSSSVTDEERAGKLIEATKENRDNHSAIIVKIEDVIE